MADSDSTPKRRGMGLVRGTPEWDAWRAKIAAGHLGKPKLKGRKPRSKPRSAEHIAKLSAARRRNPCSPAMLAANQARRGERWSHTPEAIAKIREAWKTRDWKPEWSAKAGRAKSANARELFWTSLDRSGDCWLWTGSVDRNGYGETHYVGVAKKAHRVAYALTHGPIPKGGYICHHCDNPRCCRPEHLYLGTAADNARDREERRRGERPYQRNA